MRTTQLATTTTSSLVRRFHELIEISTGPVCFELFSAQDTIDTRHTGSLPNHSARTVLTEQVDDSEDVQDKIRPSPFDVDQCRG